MSGDHLNRPVHGTVAGAAYVALPPTAVDATASGPTRLMLAWPGFDQLAVELELDFGHSAASLNSSGKYLITEVSGFGAAWPSPQIDASRIA